MNLLTSLESENINTISLHAKCNIMCMDNGHGILK